MLESRPEDVLETLETLKTVHTEETVETVETENAKLHFTGTEGMVFDIFINY